MVSGLMMETPLTVTSILRHALTFHRASEIVSRRADGGLHRYTYGDFGERVQKAANALLALGVKPGDRVATLAWNGYRHLELYYAISCIGAICHTLNPRLFRDQLVYIVNHAKDVALFFDVSLSGLVADLTKDLPSVRNLIALGEESDAQVPTVFHLHAYETLLKAASAQIEWPDLDERSACGLCYTSGTTGSPKGVLYSHRTNVLHAMTLSGADWLAVRQRDVIFPIVPMFHANAWALPYAALMNGSKLVLPGSALDGKSVHELIGAEKVTFSAGVPTVWTELIRYVREIGGNLKPLERMMVGGSAPSKSLIRTFEEDYGVTATHGWGMTELSPVGSLSSLKAEEEHLPSEERYSIKTKQGRPLFGVEMRLVDDDDNILPFDGEATGMLQVRGLCVARAYYEEETNDAFTSDGWFRTGDVASIDVEGHLEIKDRTKDLIKSGGEWISSIELEKLASDHPAVAEAACIAIPDPKWGERPLIVAVLKQGRAATASDILALYEGVIAKWCIPDRVEFVEALPHTATGKVSKLQLRQKYAMS